jgi:hypothetical protein
MLAPVYRNIETRTMFLGVGLEEALFLLATCAGLLMSMRHNELKAVGITGFLYSAIRLVNAGQAPGFAQHWVAFQLRTLIGNGHFSAAARSRCPRFPHAPYLVRDAAPLEPASRGSLSR